MQKLKNQGLLGKSLGGRSFCIMDQPFTKQQNFRLVHYLNAFADDKTNIAKMMIHVFDRAV